MQFEYVRMLQVFDEYAHVPLETCVGLYEYVIMYVHQH